MYYQEEKNQLLKTTTMNSRGKCSIDCVTVQSHVTSHCALHEHSNDREEKKCYAMTARRLLECTVHRQFAAK